MSSNLREGNWEHYYKELELKPLPFEGGFETREELHKRTQKQMNEIVSEADGSPILIVTHGGVLKEFLKSIDKEASQKYKGFRTAINRLTYVKGKFEIQSLNDNKHLEGIDLELSRRDKG